MHVQVFSFWFCCGVCSGAVRLSSVVACLCAGVKVLYAANEGEGGGEGGGEGEGEGEGGGEGRSNDRGLMTLEDIHSTLWDHSEFSDILFSTSETHHNLAAKGSQPRYVYPFSCIVKLMCVREIH